jgi:hypothetical protein
MEVLGTVDNLMDMHNHLVAEFTCEIANTGGIIFGANEMPMGFSLFYESSMRRDQAQVRTALYYCGVFFY